MIDVLTTHYTNDIVESAIDSLQSEPTQGFIYITLIYIVFTVFLIPGSVLTVGAGFAFTQASGGPAYGVLIGTLSVLTGASIGSILAFLLARYMFKSAVER